jgi:type IV pilus assembly protein PilO
MSAINRLSQKNQLIILGVLVLGLCGVFYMYFVSPMREELDLLRSDIARLENEVEQGEAVLARLEELKRAVREQEQRLRHLRTVLPEKKETAEIIRQVQNTAVESSLKIMSFAPSATVNREFYEDWPIQLTFEGNYDSLGTFFERVSSFTRLINVENIEIKALEEDTSRQRTLSASCTATTFVYLEPEEDSLVEATE